MGKHTAQFLLQSKQCADIDAFSVWAASLWILITVDDSKGKILHDKYSSNQRWVSNHGLIQGRRHELRAAGLQCRQRKQEREGALQRYFRVDETVDAGNKSGKSQLYLLTNCLRWGEAQSL